MHASSTPAAIIRVRGGLPVKETDFLATEEPLEIRLLHGPATNRRLQNVAVTMRTPGQDFDLAAGFLFTEGIIRGPADIRSVRYCSGSTANVVRVALQESVAVSMGRLERNFYTTSSCGVCGKASIDAVRAVRLLEATGGAPMYLDAEVLLALPDRLRRAQAVFEHTGGLHGCALFDATGTLLLSREDVGRHNAVDKLIGAALQQGMLPLSNGVLLLSGRASFELIQKAWMAGIPVVAAVGAPSSLAVELATEAGMTLAGFLRPGGFNIYSGPERILHSEP